MGGLYLEAVVQVGRAHLLPPSLETASEKRQRDYLAGRACAARALCRLGLTPTYVGIQSDRAPVWPAGAVGSITHTERFAAAAVARASVIRAVGIDAEYILSSDATASVVAVCLTDRERELCETSGIAANTAYTVLFSAKEALFKCLYPLVNCYFDFLDAEIEIDEEESYKLYAVLKTTLNSEFRSGHVLIGHARVSDQRVHTCFELPVVHAC